MDAVPRAPGRAQCLGGVHFLRPDLPALPLHHRRRLPVLPPEAGRNRKGADARLPSHRQADAHPHPPRPHGRRGPWLRLRQPALDRGPPAHRDLLFPRRGPRAQHKDQDAGRRLLLRPAPVLGRPGAHPRPRLRPRPDDAGGLPSHLHRPEAHGGPYLIRVLRARRQPRRHLDLPRGLLAPPGRVRRLLAEVEPEQPGARRSAFSSAESLSLPSATSGAWSSPSSSTSGRAHTCFGPAVGAFC